MFPCIRAYAYRLMTVYKPLHVCQGYIGLGFRGLGFSHLSQAGCGELAVTVWNSCCDFPLLLYKASYSEGVSDAFQRTPGTW